MPVEALPASIVFAFPGPKDTVSGGYEYDRQLCAALRRSGEGIEEITLPNGFPFPKGAQIAAAVAQIEHHVPDTVFILDGLAACAAPELCAAAKRRGKLLLLIHHPLADETGLDEEEVARFMGTECAAIQSADWVVVTSDFTKNRLIEAFGANPDRISVAEPGVETGSERPPKKIESDKEPCEFICVGSITKRKGHLDLMAALSKIDLTKASNDWRLRCIGPQDADPVCMAEVLGAAGPFGEKIVFTGPLNRSELLNEYAKSDLLITAASYEGFGMAVAEAIALGIPVIGFEGGALSTTCAGRAADLVVNHDIEALAERLLRFLNSADYRTDLRQQAMNARTALTDWDHTAHIVQTAIRHVQGAVV